MKYKCLTCQGEGAVPDSSSETGATTCSDCRGTGVSPDAPRIKALSEMYKPIDILKFTKGYRLAVFIQYDTDKWQLTCGFTPRQMTNKQVMDFTTDLIRKGWNPA
jgi:hypothetical protein